MKFHEALNEGSQLQPLLTVQGEGCPVVRGASLEQFRPCGLGILLLPVGESAQGAAGQREMSESVRRVMNV